MNLPRLEIADSSGGKWFQAVKCLGLDIAAACWALRSIGFCPWLLATVVYCQFSALWSAPGVLESNQRKRVHVINIKLPSNLQQSSCDDQRNLLPHP
jgi:hypothetical protein